MATKRPSISIEFLRTNLYGDTKVKLAGVDVDGILRGKLVSKDKFLGIAKDGFGFCSVIFGWDMHDQTYFRELKVSNAENGYHDLIAIPDLSSFRRIPWEDDVPFFLVSFFDPDTMEPVSACPRGLLNTAVQKLKDNNLGAMAGGALPRSYRCMHADIKIFLAEYEFFQFKTPGSNPNAHADARNSSSVATFLRDNPVNALPPLTEGMFGYSLTRPVHNQDYYYGIYNACEQFDCGIEGWHTESGPGVYEAALSFGEIQDMADKASLFKLVI